MLKRATEINFCFIYLGLQAWSVKRHSHEVTKWYIKGSIQFQSEHIKTVANVKTTVWCDGCSE